MKLAPLSSIFDVQYGHSLELNRLAKIPNSEGGIPFVSRKMGDNGIAAYVRRLPDVVSAPGGELTCALSGNGVLSTFIQDHSFYTAFHVARLKPRVELNRSELLYYCACIKANRYRNSYGRQANRTLKEILIPQVKAIPPWVREFDVEMYAGANAPVNAEEAPELDAAGWKAIKLSALFEIKKGKRLTKAQMLPGATPFIGSTISNNGVTARIGQKAIHEGNTISVAYNGSVAETFYQPSPFWATDDVNVLYPKFKMTPEIALFICTVIRMEKYRFNYGRKWHMKRMKSHEIRLPVKEDSTPDFNLMEYYVNSLPYSSQICR